MPNPPDSVFANEPETILRDDSSNSARERNHVLLGAYLQVVEESGDFYRVATRRAGPGGWVRKDHTTESVPLKVFFVDVGQGDGTLIECPQGVVVVDGGQGPGFHAFLRSRYWPLIRDGQRIRIEAMFVSHPDGDHFQGLERILEDEDFEVGTIYHSGLMRYPRTIEDSRPRMLQRGHVEEATLDGRDASFIVDTIDSLTDAIARVAEMPTRFREFWEAAEAAHAAGRLGGAQRLVEDDAIAGFTTKSGGRLRIRVLAPVPHEIDGEHAFVAFNEPTEHHRSAPPYPKHGYSHSHTRNGHSIVLRLEFGSFKILLGGDLNIPAEQHLLDHYGNRNPFRVDVAKACHHGSADFSPEFLKKIKPRATTISSGDNKSFDHPTADAMGAVARHSRGDLPLLFSTELARAYKSGNGSTFEIHYGLTNLRSNGTRLTMAQMKEQHSGVDIWDSYELPWDGKFHYRRR